MLSPGKQILATIAGFLFVWFVLSVTVLPAIDSLAERAAEVVNGR